MRKKIAAKYFKRLGSGVLLIAQLLTLYAFFISIHFFTCTTCHSIHWMFAALGFLYFSVLLFIFLRNPTFILKVSPYGLLWSALLALSMQLTLLALCLPCFLIHTMHVLFWTLCFYQSYAMVSISSAVFAASILLPISHFIFLPTHVDLKRFNLIEPTINGYIFNLVQPGCQFCLYEISFFNDFAKEAQKKGIKCILVSTTTDTQANNIFLKRAPYTPLITYDPTLFHPRCVIDGYPFFIFADKQGRVVSTMLGLPDDISTFFERQSNLLLP